MTSLIAWLAVDTGKRQPTTLYIASDSRQTFRNGTHSDTCRKIYLPNESADMFAFSGDVVYGQYCLAKLSDDPLFKSNFRSNEPSLEKKLARISEILKEKTPEIFTTAILYASRTGAFHNAEFHLLIFKITTTGHITSESVSTEKIQSSCLHIGGSGETAIKDVAVTYGVSSTNSSYSRDFFEIFCKSVQGGADKQSGGPIQLASLASKSCARHLGVFLSRPYYLGCHHPRNEYNGKVIDWRDSKFQRVDYHGKLLKSARHYA